MDSTFLPRYRGLADEGKAWGEPDEQGKMPTMHLRDYLVLSVIVFLCFPINLPLLLRCTMCHQKVVVEDSSRHESVWPRELEP
ncbi:MAG TPA: hypothetical protein VGY58_19060 [Gemmataceae bacterium]|jgi:hypothetical protein|nr:hypothetical protein [Gemmataceae bacterium]